MKKTTPSMEKGLWFELGIRKKVRFQKMGVEKS